MRIAIISDIHGNSFALEAVLADIKKQGVDQIICLGDLANTGPAPSQCIDIVRETADIVLQGNHELYLLGEYLPHIVDTSPFWAGLRWVREQLRPDQITYIRELPFSHEIVPTSGTTALFTHGSPKSQFLGFKTSYNEAEFEERMDGHDHISLFVGHTHEMLFQRWSHSWIMNVGSVGMSLDGTPEAKYGIATWKKGRWQTTFHFVDYDPAPLMQLFETSGYQAAGGVISALFRYQMLTGQNALSNYLSGLTQQAETLGISSDILYETYPIPSFIKDWV